MFLYNRGLKAILSSLKRHSSSPYGDHGVPYVKSTQYARSSYHISLSPFGGQHLHHGLQSRWIPWGTTTKVKVAVKQLQPGFNHVGFRGVLLLKNTSWLDCRILVSITLDSVGYYCFLKRKFWEILTSFNHVGFRGVLLQDTNEWW